MTILPLRNSVNHAPLRHGLLLIALTLASFAVSPMAQAVSPPPDGGYSGGNTAEGDNALLSLTDGDFNTAVGWYSLFSNRGGYLNTGVGAGTLASNIGDNSIPLEPKGVLNTAVGAGALLLNTDGTGNTANGALALLYNTKGKGNTAVGGQTLSFNTTGSGNTAVGARALENNTDPVDEDLDSNLNTAVGLDALRSNTTGFQNTAVGAGPGVVPRPSPDPPRVIPSALGNNTTGAGNTAVGASYVDNPAALGNNTTGERNTAVGNSALGRNTTGHENIALGVFAGSNLTTGNRNIDIGNSGVAGEWNTIRIGGAPPDPTPPPPGGAPTGSPTPEPTPTPAPSPRTFIHGIRGTTTENVDAVNVVIDSNGQLGTMSSSVRFKKEIKPMETASESILALKPVTFHYKSDTKDTPQFGLIAEEVAKVNPDLVVRDADGKVYTVRYEAVNAMLLNEFLTARRQIDVQKKQIDALTAGLQRVSAQVEMNRPAPQVVNNP
jgi:Chaperone of endosialidase